MLKGAPIFQGHKCTELHSAINIQLIYVDKCITFNNLTVQTKKKTTSFAHVPLATAVWFWSQVLLRHSWEQEHL